MDVWLISAPFGKPLVPDEQTIVAIWSGLVSFEHSNSSIFAISWERKTLVKDAFSNPASSPNITSLVSRWSSSTIRAKHSIDSTFANTIFGLVSERKKRAVAEKWRNFYVNLFRAFEKKFRRDVIVTFVIVFVRINLSYSLRIRDKDKSDILCVRVIRKLFSCCVTSID